MKFLLLFFCFLSSLITYAQQTLTNQRFTTFTINAPQLQKEKKIWVYLPKDYEKSTKKYPVIYMHDGQNLFDSSTSYSGEWNVDETLDSIKANVIVIGIEHGNEKRIEELTPFPHEKYGGGKADLYLDFLVNTLKPHIDKNYRTKTNAKNTAIFGSSLGGLISFYAAIKYPDVFGKVGCFSPAFWINRNEINDLMDKTTTFKTKIYFLCGDDEGDADIVPDMQNVVKWVNSRRCECKKLNKSVVIKGGQHNEKLWRENFKNAYLWLF